MVPDQPSNVVVEIASPHTARVPTLVRAIMFGAMYLFVASIFVSIAVNSLSLGLMGTCFVLMILWDKGRLPKRTPLDWFFLAYVAVEFVALVCSRNPAQAFVFSKRLLLLGIVYWFATWIETEHQARRVVGTLIGASAAVAMIGVVIVIVDRPLRLGIFQFYMTTSELLMMAGLVTLPFVVHPATPRRLRVIAGLALVPICVALYATVTKGAYLAFAAGVVLIAAVRNWKLIIPLAVIVLGLLLFAPPYVQNRLEGIVDIHHPENASRLALWGTGLRIVSAYPWTGVGDIDLHEVFAGFMKPGDPMEYGHLHNVALQILVTLGIPGFIVVAAMFVQVFRVEWRIFRATRDDWFKSSVALGALAVLVGLHVAGLTEWTFGDQELAVFLWVMTGMTIAVGNLPRESGEKNA